jgi:hypothetical protein
MLPAIATMLLAPLFAQAQTVPFYNYGGAIAYQPVVDTILSGTSMAVRPVVSHDRKYVTLGMSTTMQQLIRLETFPVVANAGGFVGGAAPAALAPGAVGPSADVSAPVTVHSGRGGGILNKPGMTRIE